MFCCICAGSCNHVGNHSYCAAHGGSPYTFFTRASSTTWPLTDWQPSPEPERKPENLLVAVALCSLFWLVIVLAILAWTVG